MGLRLRVAALPLLGWLVIGLTMILGGSQLVFIGIVGQYVARAFEELKGRPMYVMKQEPVKSSAIEPTE